MEVLRTATILRVVRRGVASGRGSLHGARHVLPNSRRPAQGSASARSDIGNVPGPVTNTDTGREVLEGRADHMALNGIDRWLGGVHLKGGKVAWRWDRASERIVSHP